MNGPFSIAMFTCFHDSPWSTFPLQASVPKKAPLAWQTLLIAWGEQFNTATVGFGKLGKTSCGFARCPNNFQTGLGWEMLRAKDGRLGFLCFLWFLSSALSHPSSQVSGGSLIHREGDCVSKCFIWWSECLRSRLRSRVKQRMFEQRISWLFHTSP
jgi:hypothetical protein